MSLEELVQQEKEIKELLARNQERQKLLNRIAFVEKYGVDIGDTVEWIDGKTPKKGVISKIEYSGVNPSHYIATLFNSGGKLGKRETRIWYYSLESLKLIEKAK